MSHLPNKSDSVTTLIAVVSILFLDLFWATGLKRHLATQNIDLAILILRELEKRYLPARFALAYFTAAFQKIRQDPTLDSSRFVPPPSRVDSPSRHEKQLEGNGTCDDSWPSTEHMGATLSVDWLSPDLSFSAPDLPWDTDLMGFIGEELIRNFPLGA